MKWFLLGFAIFLFKFSVAQRKDTLSQEFLMNIAPLLIDSIPAVPTNYEKLSIVYADSINNYPLGKIPDFLFDKCLDTHSPRSFHGGPSFRWMILEKVTNKRVLQAIMNKYAKLLKRKCRDRIRGKYAYLNVDLIELSFYQLFQKRYAEL